MLALEFSRLTQPLLVFASDNNTQFGSKRLVALCRFCDAGFPNMTAAALEDEATGNTYVHVRDFLCVGLPASVASWVVIVTLGYGLMYLLGF